MKAAILYGAHDLRLVDIDKPKLADNYSVLVRIKAMGICGTDVHAYHGKHATVTYPRLIGHELVGEALETGRAVTRIKPGDHVVIDPVISCGRCPACLKGRPNVCKDVMCMGVAAEGGCAEYIVIPETSLHPIPVSLPWEEAALMEPYSIAAQVVSRGEVSDGDTVLVMGAGPIGMVILQAAKRLKARVIVTDLVASRLELAESLGADLTVNPDNTDLAEAASAFTAGYGVDVAIDAVGLPDLFGQAVELAAPTGRVVIIGFNPTAGGVAELPITKKELDVRGSRMSARKFPEVIGWFARREVATRPLISHQFPLDEIQQAFDLLSAEPEKTCKVIIKL